MRGDIRVDDGRRGSRSKEAIQFTSRNIVETVGSNWRGGFMSQTSQPYYLNPGDHGILLHISGASCYVYDCLHENERGGSRGDGSSE